MIYTKNTFRLGLVLFFLGCTSIARGQQLPQRSPFGNTNFIWNPAMTAFEDYWEAGVTHRQEWVGFEDAPQTTSIYGQYPFLKENTSIGGYFMLDQIKPIKNNVLALTYAYKIGGTKRRRKGARKNGQLSLGLMGSVSHIFVDGANIVARDPNDPLQPVGEVDEFIPNVGAGLFYASRPTGPREQSFFYAGLGANQILPSDLTLRETLPAGNLPRAFHGNAQLGYRAAGEKMVVEPSLWLNFAGANIVDGQVGIHLERPEAFWAGLNYSLSQTLYIQLGYLLPSGFQEGDTLRIGALASFNLGGFGAARGLGYEFYLAYRIKA